MRDLYGLRFHPGARQASIGPCVVRLLHADTRATVANWTHAGGVEAATWVVEWANFDVGVVYEVEAAGAVIGFLFVEITGELVKTDLRLGTGACRAVSGCDRCRKWLGSAGVIHWGFVGRLPREARHLYTREV